MYKIYFGAQLEGFQESLKILKQSPRTIEAYNGGIRQFLNWLVKEKIYDLKEVTLQTLKTYQACINQKNHTVHTKYQYLKSVKRFFEYLEQRQVILINPTEKLIYPSLGDRLPQNILSEEEMTKLLNAPNTGIPIGIRDKALLELLYSTGIRKNECAKLKVYDVDYKGGSVRIDLGKGGKDRVIPLGKKACDALREYLLKIRPRLVQPGKDERSLFVSAYDGHPLSGQALAVIVKQYGRKANLKQTATIHGIRRSCATHLLKHEAHPLYIQRILGHSTGETIKKYIKVTGVDVRRTHQKTHPRERDKK